MFFVKVKVRTPAAKSGWLWFCGSQLDSLDMTNCDGRNATVNLFQMSIPQKILDGSYIKILQPDHALTL